ncbi:MAG: amidase [Thiolinea sp.]
MSDLCFQPAFQLRELLLNKQLSARELLAAFQQQIERCNPTINALVTLDFEQAGHMAQRADDHLAKTGEALGPLHGLPLAVKDVFHVAGMRTTFANQHFCDYISVDDDLLIQREKAAGAVIVGKSNTPDCAAGGVTTNELFGLTHNPWNFRKTTSGSGGGGAAAIACGLVSFADGSDVGGSARSPAGWTNCVGFRPSSGRLPGTPGSIADGSISTAGVFTRSVLDIPLFMQAVDGPSLHSAVTYPEGHAGFSVEAARNVPSGKIAWIKDFAGIRWGDDVSQRMEEVRCVMEGLGLVVDDVTLPLGDGFRQLYTDVNACAVTAGLPERVLKSCLQGEPTKPAIRAMVEHYLSLSPLDLQQIQRDVARLKVRMQLLMEEYPLLVFPTNADYAFDVDDARAEQECDWSTLYLSPMLGLPAVSVPAGFTADGMPFGMMVTGRAGEDMTVLQLAAGFERETKYYQRLPDYH